MVIRHYIKKATYTKEGYRYKTMCGITVKEDHTHHTSKPMCERCMKINEVRRSRLFRKRMERKEK